jgi:NADH-quinone oxidoreductase subunit K
VMMKGSLAGKTAVSKTAIGGSSPPPSVNLLPLPSRSMTLDLLPSLLLLFFLGTSSLFLFRNNIIVVLMGIELMLLAVNLLLVVFSVLVDDLQGQLFALFVLTVAAAESAIGLAILVVYYRLRGIIAIDYISALKG